MSGKYFECHKDMADMQQHRELQIATKWATVEHKNNCVGVCAFKSSIRLNFVTSTKLLFGRNTYWLQPILSAVGQNLDERFLDKRISNETFIASCHLRYISGRSYMMENGISFASMGHAEIFGYIQSKSLSQCSVYLRHQASNRAEYQNVCDYVGFENIKKLLQVHEVGFIFKQNEYTSSAEHNDS